MNQCECRRDRYTVTDTGCWEWQRSINRDGYGHVWKEGRCRLAHRVYYEELVGPVPEGLTLDHLCRNRACVNPDHLEPVTQAENIRRGRVATVPRATRDFIRNQRGKTTQTELAAQLGISQTAVSKIQRGASWADEHTPAPTYESGD